MHDNIQILDKNFTDRIRGLSIITIIIGHILQLFEFNFLFYKEIFFIIARLCTLSVAIFFALSGFGNILSINKNANSIRKVFTKIYRLYFEFGIAIIVFISAYYLLYKNFDVVNLTNVFSCFTTMTIPDFSWWYIKVQAIAYVILMIALLRNRHLHLIIWGLTIGLICLFIAIQLPAYWYQTVIYFPLGCLIAKYKSQISNFINQYLKNIHTIILTIFTIIIMCIKGFVFTEIFLAFGSLLCLILSTYKIPQNKIIEFFGKYSLELYIYHLVYILLFRNLSCPMCIQISLVVVSTLCTVGIIYCCKNIMRNR